MTPRWSELRSASVIFEDEEVLVVNKPAGLSVVGRPEEPDLVTLAGEAGEILKPVHRIDKVTSGAVLIAKSAAAHASLVQQFARRSVEKSYLAITRSHGLPPHGLIDLPLTTGRKDRVRVAAQRSAIAKSSQGDRWYVAPADVLPGGRIYPSATAFATVRTNGKTSFLVVHPITGRRHQIRVHLAWIGHPILGDPLFEKASDSSPERTYLHAWSIGFDAAWRGGKRVAVDAEPGEDFWLPLHDYGPRVALLDQARRLDEQLQQFHSPAVSGDDP